jgi:hypothetical protein
VGSSMLTLAFVLLLQVPPNTPVTYELELVDFVAAKVGVTPTTKGYIVTLTRQNTQQSTPTNTEEPAVTPCHTPHAPCPARIPDVGTCHSLLT